MAADSKYPIKDSMKDALVDRKTYEAMYRESVEDPDGFWRKHGERIDWIKPYTKVKNTTFERGKVDIRWYEDGTLNASVNCLDRHLAEHGDDTAIIFEGDDPSVSRHISYRELHEKTCRFANVLKGLGVKKAMWLPSTCPCLLRRLSRCWPASGSVLCILWCLGASRRRRWVHVLRMATPDS